MAHPASSAATRVCVCVRQGSRWAGVGPQKAYISAVSTVLSPIFPAETTVCVKAIAAGPR